MRNHERPERATPRPGPELIPDDTTTGPAECDTCGTSLLVRFPGRTTCAACDDERREAS